MTNFMLVGGPLVDLGGLVLVVRFVDDANLDEVDLVLQVEVVVFGGLGSFI